MSMRIDGGVSTADLVAYLTIQAAAEDKKSNDAMRASEEQVQSAEEKAELDSMETKAIEGLAGGLLSAGTKAIGAGVGVVSAGKLTGLDDKAFKVAEAKREDVARLFDATTKLGDTATTGAVGFEDKNIEQHKIAAGHAREAADKLADDAKHAQGASDAGIQAARDIRQTEDRTLLLTAQKA